MAESAENFHYCPGYVDEHGQWNNGFTCPKWSSSPTQQYCCGSQYKRYCCTPGESPSTVLTLATTPRVTTVAVVSSELENIPLVVGIAVGGVVLFIIFMLLCCFLCPCCLLNRNRGRKRPPSDDEASIDGRDMRRRSDISSHTLRTSVNTQFTSTPSRAESPPPPGTTQLPLVIDRQGMDGRPHTCQNNYRGIVIGTVPPYMREEPPPYPAEVLEGLKPLTCSQFQCCQKNCVHHSYRTPEVCPHEEVDPLVHHVGNHQTSTVTNLLPQNYQHHTQGRYARAHSPRPVSPSPGHNATPCRHVQIQNRYAM
ncbi:uncharacterized protein LOC135470278 isoform X2 [Liolophura sinensis]|uniref:uncharacterized protein LOC135470278 isoform X2 n=1 Tax=Liolophura sinensis TaxID=3198878 RepID=UPI00315804CE